MQTQTQQAAPQWRTALDNANKVRLARARYRRDIREGKYSARDVLVHPEDIALDVPVAEILTWLPGIKRKRALRILNGIVLSEVMTLGRLSPVTRERILARVVHHQPTPCRTAGHYSDAA